VSDALADPLGSGDLFLTFEPGTTLDGAATATGTMNTAAGIEAFTVVDVNVALRRLECAAADPAAAGAWTITASTGITPQVVPQSGNAHL